ncbi:FAD:protein FMN transferase [Mesorhizobium sp. ZMM04-5]|uniref:FAD:protein FMN transferase n=1 Tax=Mesorhizobium marinum TaxID=3228790 RepID=A0ABV3QWK1_9HYPH
MTQMTRRRFIGISAAAAGLSLLPFGTVAGDMPDAVVWRGRAMGAAAELILHHRDRELARALVARMAGEIDRLERIFSLYVPDSSLSQLNAAGALAAPPRELIELLSLCRDVWAASAGAFDPTVQPLWALHARHFASANADPAGPAQDEIEAALALVGFGRLAFDNSRVALPLKGMALTLNGIAQGFLTDRIVGMLRDAGVTDTLADIGEVRAMGRRGDGSPWRVGIGGLGDTVELVDRAIATSSPDGFRFAGPGSPAHLLDPRTGRSARRYGCVSVLSPGAAAADGLSTACNFLDPPAIEALLAAFPETQVRLRSADGRRLRLG